MIHQPSIMSPSNASSHYFEIIHPDAPRGNFKCALFDFDGTLSLIRRGWREIMVPYFVEEIMACPNAPVKEETERIVREFVTRLTGKQTIYQCIHLGQTVSKYGGRPKDPLVYKKEYLARLWTRIENSFNSLKNKSRPADDLLIKGSRRFLNALTQRGVKLYLASGTDQVNVLEEAAVLELSDFFEDRIFGAKDNWKEFSKNMIISKIIEENRLMGDGLLVIGDGYVEIEEGKAAGGYALGVACDEMKEGELDPWKRNRLIEAGADAIIIDYDDTQGLMNYLFPE
jgi:phosphoglycolate phosphatase